MINCKRLINKVRLKGNKVRSNFLVYNYFNYQNLNNEQSIPGPVSGAGTDCSSSIVQSPNFRKKRHNIHSSIKAEPEKSLGGQDGMRGLRPHGW
jgi:hypothetical protein